MCQPRKRANGKGSKWITPLRRLSIYLRDRFACAYCARDLHTLPSARVTLDHLEPKVNGANHASDNLVTACTWCNSRRQDMDLRTFVRSLVDAELAASGTDATDAERRQETGRRVHKIRMQARRKLPLSLARSILSGAAEDPRAASAPVTSEV